MTVLSYDNEDLFTLRIVKRHASNPDLKWANSYEFRATAAGSTDELLALASAWVSFEQHMHKTFCLFDRLVISTWEADSTPYNPSNFISTTLTGAGLFGGSGDASPLTQALSVTRQATSGRFGHIFYRGFLDEPAVFSPAGKPTLVARDDVQDTLDSAISSAGVDDFIGATPAGAFGLVMVNKDGTQIRPVYSLRAQGVAQLPLDHAWYNRTGPAPV